MKTIGLIGGMSWTSTVTYYQIINTVVSEKLGRLHSAKCILYSVDFAEIEECQAIGDWEKSAVILAEAAKSLEKAGADFIVICTNTMHKVAEQVGSAVHIPILHIAEATADELLQQNIRKVALLGTRYTMEQDFYKLKLIEKGITVMIPDEADRNRIHSVIYDELCSNIISDRSKQDFISVVEKLGEQGAQGVILGCTEIGLLLQQEDVELPLFDTALIHAKRAALCSIE